MELIYDVAEVVANLFDGFLSLIFISLLCGRKKDIKLPLFLIGILGFVIPLSLISEYVFVVPAQVLIWFVLLIVFATIFLNKSMGKKIYYVFIWNIVLMLSNILVAYGFVYLFKLDKDVITQPGSVYRLFIIIIGKMCLLFLCILFVYFEKRHSVDYKQWLITIIQFGGTLFIGAIITNLYLNNIIDEKSANELILVAIALFIMCIVICACQFIINKQNLYKVEYEKLRAHLDGEEKNIEKIKELYENSSILRHDIKHYAIMVRALLKEKEYGKIEHIMDEMIEEKLVDDTVLYTSSDMLNAVLNNKLSICKKNNIRFEVEISCVIPEEKILNVCVIMSNLLDNAIEAEEKEDEGVIRCKINRNEDMLCIHIGNKISKSVLTDNPQLVTSKCDKKNHGFGTKSIIKRVKEMDGTYQVFETKSEFIVEIFIPFSLSDV